jgi:hypothetical protein
MIDDEIRAQFEMLAPTTVNSSQQSPSVSAQDESYSRAPAVLALGIPVVGVFPCGATVIWRAGRKTAEIATGNGHEHGGVELIGDQPELIVKCDKPEGGRGIAICKIDQTVLQPPTDCRLSR